MATKIVVKTKNSSETIKPRGNYWVIASKAAGRLNPSKAVDTETVLHNSKAIPEPSMMVNQKVVMIGATYDGMMMMIDRIYRPRETRAMNIAISGHSP